MLGAAAVAALAWAGHAGATQGGQGEIHVVADALHLLAASAWLGALVPLALRGVQYRPMGASALLRWNLLVYGVGGIIAPFIGIKLIDLVITSLRWA